MKSFFAIATLCMALSACAGQPTETGSHAHAESCKNLHVILPGNFIIDLAADSEVILNPAMQEFVLFCSAADARKAIDAGVAAKSLPAEADWRVYRLLGDFGELAQSCGPERYCLQSPAVVAEWVETE